MQKRLKALWPGEEKRRLPEGMVKLKGSRPRKKRSSCNRKLMAQWSKAKREKRAADLGK
jgi:hypothetical protein